MDALHAAKLRLAIVLLMITALVFTGVGVPASGDGVLMSEAWAGGGHHHDDDDDDDDDRRNRDKNKKKDFDHFACYTAAAHDVNTDVKIINQFTKDEYGKIVKLPITVGELAFLCVPTKKIHPEDETKPGRKPKK